VEPLTKDPIESELNRVVNKLPGLVWGALPDGHSDFLNQPGANTRVLPLAKLVAADGA
jgi:hypothetical protein